MQEVATHDMKTCFHDFAICSWNTLQIKDFFIVNCNIHAQAMVESDLYTYNYQHMNTISHIAYFGWGQFITMWLWTKSALFWTKFLKYKNTDLCHRFMNYIYYYTSTYHPMTPPQSCDTRVHLS